MQLNVCSTGGLRLQKRGARFDRHLLCVPLARTRVIGDRSAAWALLDHLQGRGRVVVLPAPKRPRGRMTYARDRWFDRARRVQLGSKFLEIGASGSRSSSKRRQPASSIGRPFATARRNIQQRAMLERPTLPRRPRRSGRRGTTAHLLEPAIDGLPGARRLNPRRQEIAAPLIQGRGPRRG